MDAIRHELTNRSYIMKNSTNRYLSPTITCLVNVPMVHIINEEIIIRNIHRKRPSSGRYLPPDDGAAVPIPDEEEFPLNDWVPSSFPTQFPKYNPAITAPEREFIH